MKIKIVAIAKDEAAYLPEWIFHHLYFGFDQIDIYVNNTSDNSWDIYEKIAGKLPVNFIDGDSFFLLDGPQQSVYKHALAESSIAGFTHLMFLDIDEFWTPVDMATGIKECLNSLDGNVVNFEWHNKLEDKEFSYSLEDNMEVEHHDLIKTVFQTNMSDIKINIHNIKSPEAKYVLSDNTTPVFDEKKLMILSPLKTEKPYIIIHRMYRSQMEYVSLLGRSRPKKIDDAPRLKDNRHGFCLRRFPVKKITLPSAPLIHYRKEYDRFLFEYLLSEEIERGKGFVKKRFREVLMIIEGSPSNQVQKIRHILRNVDNSDVLKSLNTFLFKSFDDIFRGSVDALRDGAILLERKDIKKAYKLMDIALILRPRGKKIISKIAEYKEAIKKYKE